MWWWRWWWSTRSRTRRWPSQRAAWCLKCWNAITSSNGSSNSFQAVTERHDEKREEKRSVLFFYYLSLFPITVAHASSVIFLFSTVWAFPKLFSVVSSFSVSLSLSHFALNLRLKAVLELNLPSILSHSFVFVVVHGFKNLLHGVIASLTRNGLLSGPRPHGHLTLHITYEPKSRG